VRHAELGLMIGAAALSVATGPAVFAQVPPANPAAPASLAPPFAAPTGPMLLSRTLRRPLPDGAEFVAGRTYEIQFVREDTGYRIEGRLVAVDVRAPDSLAVFAELERKRPDTGMFPLHLDAAGMLIPAAGAPSGAEVRKAVAIALDRLGQRSVPAVDLVEAQTFVQSIGKRPAMSQWPADIFRPLAANSSKSSVVPLPDGTSGHITIEIAARTQGSGGLMREMTRAVTTDLGGNLRHTFETWTLAPAHN
jgi:hypothetical protein